MLQSTDGWPAGVGLLLDGPLGSRPGPSQRDWSPTSDIAELLRTEVLDQLSAAQQSFLTRVGFLDAWTPSLCDRVTGTGDGESTLKELAASATFVLRVDDHDGWYRPHQLLGDLLRADFDRLADDERAELRARASEWYEAHGLVADAVEQAIAAGDETRAMDLVLLHAFALTDLGRQQLVAEVLRAPAVELADDPEHLLRIAVAFGLTGQGAATLHALDLLERLPDADDGVRGLAATLRCLISSYAGDLHTAERADADAARLLATPPSDEMGLRARLNLARCLRMAGRLDDAEHLLRELTAMGDEQETTPSIFARASWSQVLLDRGALDRAREQAELAVERWRERGMGRVVGMTDAFRTIATHANELGASEDAGRARHEALRASAALRPGLGRALVMIDAARTAADDGNLVAADDALADVRAWWRDFPPGPQLLHAFHLAQFDVALAADDHHLASMAAGLVDHLDHAVLHPFGPLVRARLHLAAETTTEDDLNHCTLPPTAPLPRRIESLLVMAEVAAAIGDEERSVAFAGRALELGLPAGYRRTFARSKIVRGLREELLPPSFVGAFRSVLSPNLRARQLPGLPTFTERELEVLHLLPTHLSYSGIAAELFISVNTAKFHVKNLYAKLEVGDRDAAVQRARQLGLLG